MKRMINRKNIKLRKDEAGFALMWVLVLMILAAIILVPLLLLMTSGLHSSAHHEDRMLRFYAADAGIEDAIWKIGHGDPPTEQYSLPPVNGMDVLVTPAEGDTMQGFFGALLEIPGGGVLHKAAPASDWMVTYALLDEDSYVIEVVYQPLGGVPEEKKIDGMGAWLFGGFDYVAGTASGVTDDYPIYEFQTKRYGGGSAFIWEWKAANRPVAVVGDTLTLTFDFTPEGQPSPHVGWVDAGSDNIFISWSGVVSMNHIQAQATDPTTDKNTIVTSLVVIQDTGSTILTYSYDSY